MRQIKFRAWHKQDKKMFYPDALMFRDADGGAPNILIVTGKGEGWPEVTGFIGSSFVELMQSTGLLDENGKEIYEGDVYKRPNLNAGYGDPNEPDDIVEVLRDISELYGEDNEHPHIRSAKVIGNRFETPELLESRP